MAGRAPLFVLDPAGPAARAHYTPARCAAASRAIGERQDSGVDVVCPVDLVVPARAGADSDSPAFTIDLGVRAVCLTARGPSAFWLVPRSSFAKTPLVLANHLGLIDASYRGSLIAKVRNLDAKPFRIAAGTALFQLAAPSLLPPEVRLLGPELPGDVFAPTARGAGGFGSTSA